MAYKIKEIQGIGSALGRRLARAGITTTGELLYRCGSPAGRREISAAVRVSEQELLRWANLADLMRVHGIGRQYAELLEAAGVDTTRELRTRNPDHLAERLSELNADRKFAKVSPPRSVVRNWVERARRLTPMIEH